MDCGYVRRRVLERDAGGGGGNAGGGGGDASGARGAVSFVILKDDTERISENGQKG